MADTTIIYDFGANAGQNLGYYLQKAARVVAVEANPVLCRMIEERFAAEIAAGRLIVENVVLLAHRGPPTTPFFIHRHNHVLSQLPPPAADKAGQFMEVVLPARHVVDVVAHHGPAHYIKIDIEHSDAAILRALLADGITPDYISAESHDVAVFCLLVALGNYGAFKLVNGPSVQDVFAEHFIDTPQGRSIRTFPRHSAGPFGNDLPGPWLDTTALFQLLGREGLGWKDIHASRVDKPVAPHRDVPAATLPPTKLRTTAMTPGDRSGCVHGDLLVVAKPLLFMTSTGQPIVATAIHNSIQLRTPDAHLQAAAAACSLPLVVHDEPAIIPACLWDGAFYHFLYDVLGKLAVAESRGFSPADHTVYFTTVHQWQRDALRLLGLDPRPLAAGVVHKFTCGVIPTYADGRRGGATPVSIRFLRRMRVPEVDSLPARKLFLSRSPGSNGRRLENEAEIYDRSFRPLGYERLDPGALAFDEQCRLFSQVTHVAGPHGAAFSLMCLGRQPLSVIELHSPHYYTQYYRRVANVLGARYAAFNSREVPFQPAHWKADYSLDADAVATWLQSLPPEML